MMRQQSVNRMADALRSAVVVRPCYPKAMNTTRGAAESQLRSIVRRGYEGRPGLRAYLCPACGSWHVGHERGAK